MHVAIETLPDFRVACMRHTGPYGDGGIARLWEKMSKWCDEQGFRNPRHNMFGISRDDPNTTPPEQCRYDAAVEVAADFVPTAEVSVDEIPSGTYACADFRGTAEEVGAAWHWFGGEWLASSGFRFDPRPCFELYPANINTMPEPGIFVCKICIPVAPK
jgi:AraC family transcriptional regulator